MTVPELLSTKTHVDEGEIYDAAFSGTTVCSDLRILRHNNADWVSWLLRQP